ncbi:MAG TPA: DUF4834 family protein [Prolixibacteraceae bacterium]|nr:DUF4834 family protein [Prolixibacteraceae bacterium]
MITVILFLVNLIRTLLVLLILVFLVRWLIRLFTPSHQNSREGAPQNAREGETTLRFNQKGEKIVDKDKGEYVDFEEID